MLPLLSTLGLSAPGDRQRAQAGPRVHLLRGLGGHTSSLLKDVPKLWPGTCESPVPMTPQCCGCPARADPAEFCPTLLVVGPRSLSSFLSPGLSRLLPGTAEPLGSWSKLKAHFPSLALSSLGLQREVSLSLRRSAG